MSLAPTLLFSDCSSQTDRRTTDIAKTEEGQRVAYGQIQRQAPLKRMGIIIAIFTVSICEFRNERQLA